MEPYGLALKAYWEGKKDAKVIFHRDDGLVEEFFVNHCFREPINFSDIEIKALNSCVGKVLDVGAGVGPHSLYLQKQGSDVFALDVSEEACKIMNDRGIKHVMCSEFYDLHKELFDTILLMGRAIGFVEDLAGMKKFLIHCGKLLNPNGMILFDSLDVRKTSVPEILTYQERSRKMGLYIGVVGLQMEYEGQYGQPFKILRVDPDMVGKIAEELNWKCKILHKEKDGNYLAKVTKI